MTRFIAFVLLAVLALSAHSGVIVSDGVGYKQITFPPTTMGGSPQTYTVSTGPVVDNYGATSYTSTGQSTVRILPVNGSPAASYQYGVKNPSGNPLVVDVEARVVRSSIKPLLKEALRIIPVIDKAYSIYRLAQELGYLLKKEPDGTVTAVRDAGDTCLDPFGCTMYAWNDWLRAGNGYLSSKDKACAVIGPLYASNRGLDTVPSCALAPSGSTCKCGSDEGLVIESTHADYKGAPTSVPIDQVLDDIANKTNYPSTSDIGKAIEDASKITGMPIPLEPATIKGPQRTRGPTTGSDHFTGPGQGTTSQTVTIHNHNYIDNRIITNTQTSTTTYQAGNPDPISTSSTSSTPPGTEPQPDPCESNPNRVGCIDAGTPPDTGKVDAKTVNIEVVQAAFTSSAQCPSGVSFSAFGRSYTLGYQPICDFMALIKPLILALSAVASAYILANSFRV